jgi:hypothetical protein
VHLFARLRQESGDFFLEFDLPTSGLSVFGIFSIGGKPPALLLTAFDRMLHLLAPTSPKPFLVLHTVPSGPSAIEYVNQVLLRNAFASRLFQLGNVQAVITTGGLLHDELLTQTYAAFLRALEGGREVGDLARALRQARPSVADLTPGQAWGSAPLDDVLTAATALFTHDPDAVPPRAVWLG